MKIKTKLYSHQKDAVKKLISIKVGALYMEQGTGKTRTALELFYRRFIAGKVDCLLWLCPCNALPDIQDNILFHADMDKNTLVMCGIETLSSSVRANERLQALVKERCCFLVVDESLMVKNPQAIRTRNITRLATQCQYKLILNGTPISRTEADLFAQWYLLDWRILGYQSYWSFAANHLEIDEQTGHIRRAHNVDYLTSKIAPYCYEIQKKDCFNLPPKRYSSYWFSLTPQQREDYERTKMEFLNSGVIGTQYETTAIYRTFTALQQICSGRTIISHYNDPIQHVPTFDNPNQNPRIQALLTALDERVLNEQAVIWCRFSHEVEDIQKVLTERGEEVSIFNGSFSPKKRQKARQRFQAGAHYLLANKACGQFGLNLQYCHNAIYYNNDWDWATRVQSEDRLHRNGQKHEVRIIDICADSSIEERIMTSLATKESLEDRFKSNLKKKNLCQLAAWLDERSDHDGLGWSDR